MLAAVLLASTLERSYSPEFVKHAFETALAGVRPQGERFESIIDRVGVKLFGPESVDKRLSHPIGWASAAVVRFQHRAQVILIRRAHGRTLADVLPYGRVPREADYDRWTYLFAWSRGRLAEFYTYEGSGSSLYGEVYAQAGRRWRLVQSLDEHGELSMQGYNITDRIRSRNPAVVEFNFTDHEWLEKYFHGSHFAPGLKYRERWLFANGRLRRTVFYRVPNAMATLYDLKVDARHARRSDFDNRVPKAFRQQLWALLSKSPENRIGHDPTHDDHIDPDDSRDLLVDDYWRLHFAKTRRGWAPASMKYRKNGWW